MAVKVTSNVNIKARIQKRLIEKQTAFKIACIDEKAEIVSRTAAGEDRDGNLFDKYDDKYARRREIRGEQVYPPNLTVTGDMLASVNLEFSGNTSAFTAKIGLIDQVQKTKAFWTNELRPWFGLNQKQIDYIKSEVKKA
jgi:hypothetical protein